MVGLLLACAWRNFVKTEILNIYAAVYGPKIEQWQPESISSPPPFLQEVLFQPRYVIVNILDYLNTYGEVGHIKVLY